MFCEIATGKSAINERNQYERGRGWQANKKQQETTRNNKKQQEKTSQYLVCSTKRRWFRWLADSSGQPNRRYFRPFPMRGML